MSGDGNRRLIWAIVLAMLAGAALIGWVTASSTVDDSRLFADWGSTMLSGDWARTYGDPAVQAGPAELALAGIAGRIAWSNAGFAILLDVACMLAIAAGVLVIFERRAFALALVAAGAFLLWLPGQAYLGHPAELLIAVLWVLAARSAGRGRTTVAGALIGLSGCLELWGLLGVTALALAPSIRRAGKGVLLAALLPALAFAPFASFGSFKMLEFHWIIHNTVPSFLFGGGGSFTWQMRVLEGAVVVAAGVTVARLTRRLPSSVWLVPLVTVLCRMLLDPLIYPYYWNTAQLLAVIGVAELVIDRVQIRAKLAARLRGGRPVRERDEEPSTAF